MQRRILVTTMAILMALVLAGVWAVEGVVAETAYQLGDANQSGEINIGDVVYIELAVLGYVPVTAECDANGDHAVNVGDAIWTELVIAGLRPAVVGAEMTSPGP